MVADAMGVTDAVIFGDILCARIQQRGVAGLVTDGAVRDPDRILHVGRTAADEVELAGELRKVSDKDVC